MPKRCVSCSKLSSNSGPQIEVTTEGKAPKEVINIMAALKESMQAKGRAKVRDAVRRRMGKPSDACVGAAPTEQHDAAAVAQLFKCGLVAR